MLNRRGFVGRLASIGASIAAADLSTLLFDNSLHAQVSFENLAPVLNQNLQTPEVVEFQLRQYLVQRIPKLVPPPTSEEWTKEAQRLRQHALNDVVFHGWPEEWVQSTGRFEDLGLIATGEGYRLRKLRYEIVPGFQSVALLYEPARIKGKTPAILNLNGHGVWGKAGDYKQKRCINDALRGMYALSLEWLGCGELDDPENSHWFAAHLNLVGMNGSGLFYLAMRKGLDYLWDHPGVDRERIGVTGLSGGAWQTITLSSLDERVKAAVPVSGYFPLIGSVSRIDDAGDPEYNPPDLMVDVDYTTLTAMRAPRPTLLIYGTVDEYCCRAQMEKVELYDPIKPFYRLYGKEESFAWHENTDPGTHNYQLDNRQQSYAFFSKHFNLESSALEISVDAELKNSQQLTVGIPKNNLTILGLAKKIAASRNGLLPVRVEQMSAYRNDLRSVIRYKQIHLKRPWAASSVKYMAFSSVAYRLEMSDGLYATGIWLKSNSIREDAPTVLVLDDKGTHGMEEVVTSSGTAGNPGRTESPIAWYLNRGFQIWAVNPLFTGDATPEKGNIFDFGPIAQYSQLLSCVGERPLGMRVAQLVALVQWLKEERNVKEFKIDCSGLRSQITALVTAAIYPGLFSELRIRKGIKSFQYLLDHPVKYQQAPELFCLDLYHKFDVNVLEKLGTPTSIFTESSE